jgi:ElaB/YqjD/DUF883 family membrane-anchored ribosome-binding protein
MAKKKKRPSIKPVVNAIKRTTDQLEDILENASPAQKKKLKLKIRALANLNRLASRMCHNKTTLSM